MVSSDDTFELAACLRIFECTSSTFRSEIHESLDSVYLY